MDKRETLLGTVIILHSDQYNSVVVGKASASHALDIIQVFFISILRMTQSRTAADRLLPEINGGATGGR
jgi:hypothetical protein